MATVATAFSSLNLHSNRYLDKSLSQFLAQGFSISNNHRQPQSAQSVWNGVIQHIFHRRNAVKWRTRLCLKSGHMSSTYLGPASIVDELSNTQPGVELRRTTLGIPITSHRPLITPLHQAPRVMTLHLKQRSHMKCLFILYHGVKACFQLRADCQQGRDAWPCYARCRQVNTMQDKGRHDHRLETAWRKIHAWTLNCFKYSRFDNRTGAIPKLGIEQESTRPG